MEFLIHRLELEHMQLNIHLLIHLAAVQVQHKALLLTFAQESALQNWMNWFRYIRIRLTEK